MKLAHGYTAIKIYMELDFSMTHLKEQQMSWDIN